MHKLNIYWGRPTRTAVAFPETTPKQPYGGPELLSKEAQRRKMSWDAAIWQIVQFLMTSSWELRAANHTTSKKLTTLKSDRNSPGISVPPRDVHMAISGSAQ